MRWSRAFFVILRLTLPLHMSETQQELLRKAWTEGRNGYLSAWSEAKLWAIREIWRAEKDSEHGLQTFAASQVMKSGTNEHPSQRAVGKLFERMDADPDWFPGKITREVNGPKRTLTGQQRSAIARSAQAMKARGVEPTYSNVVATCPNATLNSETGKTVDKKRVYTVFRETCKDADAEENWQHKARYSKVALTSEQMTKRYEFGVHIQSSDRTQVYYYNHIVWTDICNSVLPRSEQKASEQALARKGKKGWLSPGCELHSANLRGSKDCENQASWGTVKIWWAPILTRGKLHVEVLDANFPGETQRGASILVSKVRAAINVRFQGGASKPDMVWTDRGKGFYSPCNGAITAAYKQALRAHHLKPAMGDDASLQPGNLQELMLHETSVAWIRDGLAKSVPAKAWEESREQYEARLKRIVEELNGKNDVEGLCRSFLARIDKLVAGESGRLRE